jgi:hypothetical protein
VTGLTIRGYARHRGVSHTAVRKAIASGRITPSQGGGIDPKQADREWATSTDLSKPRNSISGVPKKQKAIGAPSDPIGVSGLEASPLRATGDGDASRLVSSYAASRAAREAYLARLAKLEFEQRSEKLVDADLVRRHNFELTRRARDTLMGIPDRLAPLLVGQVDQAIIHEMLTDELTIGLAELSTAPPILLKPNAEDRP